MQVSLPFGSGWISAGVPDDAVAVGQSFGAKVEPELDPAAAVARAIAEPLDRARLADAARPGQRVTIAFDDPTVPCFVPIWEPAIRAVLAELDRAGVARRDITLLCANSLHRKFTHRELSGILGRALVEEFGYRLTCHDAEDAANLVHLGRTRSGYDVELSRLATDTDLLVYVNTTCWRGFNGGWKSIAVGLSSFRSIRWHHSPDGMSMSTSRNVMHEYLDEMGEVIEARLGPDRIFKIETVLANPMQLGRMWSGSVRATRRAALEVLQGSHTARRDLVPGKADVVLYGVPAWSPYAAYARMNPILTLLSTGLGYLGGVIEGVGKPGCSVILATPCDDDWDDEHHPSYREVWTRVLARTRDPYEIQDRFQDDFAHRPEYLYRYRHCHAFHPVHGILATFPLKRLKHAARVYVAGARRPELCEHLGFIPTPSVEDALERAAAEHGGAPSVAVVKYPQAFNRV